ncbi:MAG TPA: hypothetical protein VFO76_11300 [Candidatus Kapabacteria bacterium]|nr:hypothetical protein [Candidatus Kapabacteria bacterium]
MAIIHRKHPDVKTLPIVIGLTGHRDLQPEDIIPLKQSIERIYRDMLDRFPSTPLTVLSSLAEGADRIGAEVALELGLDLICPLPLDPDLYRMDFQTEASREEFDRYLAAAHSWFALPLVEGATAEGVKQYGYERDLQYAQVGAYHAQHSQIMIALWDGQVLDSIGGTGKVVNYKLQGVPKIFGRTQSPLDPVETGPVYHILTPRVMNPEVHGVPYEIKKYYPRGYGTDEDAEMAFQKIFDQIDLFNADTIKLAAHLVKEKPQGEAWLYGDLPKENFSIELLSILDHYSTADCLASYYQRYTKRAFLFVFGFVLCAAVFFDLYAHLFHDVQEVLIGYLGSLLASYLWFSYAKKKHYQTKYLDYRALAEGLRVQFFWRYMGLKHTAGDYYIRKQKSEMDWIRYAMRTAALPKGDTVGSEFDDTRIAERTKAVMHSWVVDQAKYYPKALKRDHHKLHRLEKAINAFFYIGVGLVIVMLFIELPHELKDLFVVAAGLAPILAALFGAYIERNALVGHIKQYERMEGLFHQAKDYLTDVIASGNYSEASEFIFELGTEALAESGDWMLLHRDRPIEMPKG